MSIPESQLETWSHQGSVGQSSSTYVTIKGALEADDAEYASKSFKVFLQGSYCNDTNIYAESDVDIVIRLDSTFYYDLSALPPDESSAVQATLSPAAYSYTDFKAHVLAALNDRFAADVTAGSKAFKIKANGGRRSADVVVAAAFRRYHRSLGLGGASFDEGICFFDASGNRVVNYPQQHSANCTTKHQATGTWFKPTVRILKNLRSSLVDGGLIDRRLAPSYFLEGLLYNVPNETFGGSCQGTMVAALNWIGSADRSKFVCANQQYYLLGDSSAVQWPGVDCDRFLTEVIRLWNDWS